MSSEPSESLHQGRFLELRRRGRWEYVQRTGTSAGAAFMIATTAQNELLLVEQHRNPVGAAVLELPAGVIGDEHPGESPEQAADRELLEETGYRAARIERIHDAPTAAGLCAEWAYYLRMRELRREHAGGGVDGENITVHHLPLELATDWLREQTLSIDARVFAALYWLSLED